ncbi:hypothetical protein RUND412_011185 [Rhizina undulata]
MASVWGWIRSKYAGNVTVTEDQKAEIEDLQKKLDLAYRDSQKNASFINELNRILKEDNDSESPKAQDDICRVIDDLQQNYDKLIETDRQNIRDLLEKNRGLEAYLGRLKGDYGTLEEIERQNSDLREKNRKLEEAHAARQKENDDKLKEVERQNSGLLENYQGLEAYAASLKANDEYQRIAYEKLAQEMLQAKQQHEAELVSLKRIHFRTVQDFDGGVEPINDDSIASRFATLRDAVDDWVRLSFNFSPQMTSPKFPREMEQTAQRLFSQRALGLGQISSADILKAIVWDVLETCVFQPWLFGLEEDLENSIRKMENIVETLGPDKTQEWRVYNILRLRNSPQINQSKETRINEIVDKALGILSSITEPREDRISPDVRLQKLRSIIRSAAELATELKTQKAVFEVEYGVEPDVAFDPEAMLEIQFKEEPEALKARRAMVSCVISRGWIKKGGGGNVDDLCRICLARVKAV